MTEQPKVEHLRLMGAASVEDMHESADFTHLHVIEGQGENGIYGAIAYVPYVGEFNGWERQLAKELKARWNATKEAGISVEALEDGIVEDMLDVVRCVAGEEGYENIRGTHAARILDRLEDGEI